MLERFAPDAPHEPHYAHLVVETLRRVFHDRARYLGDSDFAAIPVSGLLDRRYLERRAASIASACRWPMRWTCWS